MREHWFSLTRILLYKDKIYDFYLNRRTRVSENPHFRTFYATLLAFNKVNVSSLQISHYTTSVRHLFFLFRVEKRGGDSNIKIFIEN